MKRVVISCTPNSAYDFFLPIATRLWRRVGYEPIVILVGGQGDWGAGHAQVACDEVRRSERVEFFGGIPGIPDSAVSMGLRQHVCALDLPPDELLLVGDIDLFPVDGNYYHQHDPVKNPVGVYQADTYGDEYWPAYGVSMPVRVWREVMGVALGDFRGSVERSFCRENVKVAGLKMDGDKWGPELWTFDERYTSSRIRGSRFSKDVALFSRSFDGKLPWRFKLPAQPYVFDYIDFHCSRPGWTEENWPDLRYALAQLIPEDLRWLDRYAASYRRSLEGGPRVARQDLLASPLPWDSAAFGLCVGLLDPGSPLPESRDIAWGNSGKYDVVFVKTDGWRDPAGAVATDHTYDMELDATPHTQDVQAIAFGAPRKGHAEIARGAFPDSRFNRDPRLRGKVGDFYEKWLSGDGTLYWLEAVPEDAFLFVRVDPDGAGRISLVAVHEKSRGIGIGRALINSVMQFRKFTRTWRVRVSARNAMAIRFYETLGFKVKSAQTAYHVWTSEARPE